MRKERQEKGRGGGGGGSGGSGGSGDGGACYQCSPSGGRQQLGRASCLPPSR